MNIFTDILDFIAPRYCPICEKRLGSMEKDICTLCLNGLPRTNAHLMKENPIEKIYWTHIPIERATSFFFYETYETRETIHQLKYFDNPHIGETVSRVMARELKDADFFDGIDLIIPVPLHWKRRMKRGYNQCEYIAKGISQVTNIPIATDVVKRTVNNKSQTTKKIVERRENVENIFKLVHPEKIQGKHILLVDDVITTGSTTISCGKELAHAENVKISVISMGYAGRKFIGTTDN